MIYLNWATAVEAITIRIAVIWVWTAEVKMWDRWRRFIIVYRVSRHSVLFWASSIQSASQNHIWILVLYPRICFLRGPFPWSLSIKILYFLSRPCPSHHPRFNHPNNIRWTVQIMKLRIIIFFLLLPLSFNFSSASCSHTQSTVCSCHRNIKCHTHIQQQVTLWFCMFYNYVLLQKKGW
jgi:hypothetical protein